jgi:hypothetical protein
MSLWSYKNAPEQLKTAKTLDGKRVHRLETVISRQKKPAGIPLGEATLIQYLISSV